MCVSRSIYKYTNVRFRYTEGGETEIGDGPYTGADPEFLFCFVQGRRNMEIK